TYLTNGNYIVCLFIVTSTGCQSSYCDTISITCNQPGCGAGFQFTMPQCPTVNFFGTGTTTSGSVTSYNWTFGDGSTGTGQNPTHTYTANGSYVACLSIGTSTGCSATYCDTVTISCITPQCQASFNANLTGCPQILFNSTSVASSGSITSYSWTFGDGSSGTGQNTAHTYLTNGNYIVCLFIVTSTGCQSTYCDTISITCNPPVQCQAAFTSQSTPNLFAQFTDLSTATGSILTWNWSFGDGSTSTMQNPSHVYTQPGFYIVCLTITATDSMAGFCSSTTCDTIAIGNVAIDRPSPFQDVSVYPNPFVNSIRIRYSLTQVTDLRLSLYDALGLEILHQNVPQVAPGQQEATLDTGSLPAGTYFLRMQSMDGAITLPVLRQ
ncbi:MAG: PKD domain-containing protein, partial [Bacteroidia bacterium]